MSRKLLLVLLALKLTILLPAAWSQSYSVTDLGVLPGYSTGYAFSINSIGAVAGCSDTSASQTSFCTGQTAAHATVWSAAGGLQDIGTLPGYTDSIARGINTAGTVVGGTGPNNGHAFRWSSTVGITDLGTLRGGTTSFAQAINTSGVAVGSSNTASFTSHAVMWKNGKIADLGSLSGGTFAASAGINDVGEVVGYGTDAAFVFHGFLWTQKLGIVELPFLSGGTSDFAFQVNASGIIAGQSDGAGFVGHPHAVLWSNKGKSITDLGTLTGDLTSSGSAINDNNAIVGASSNAAGTMRAFRWTKKSGITDLNARIPAGSGWFLNAANAINNAGQIVGYGTLNGANHAFLLTPQ